MSEKRILRLLADADKVEGRQLMIHANLPVPIFEIALHRLVHELGFVVRDGETADSHYRLTASGRSQYALMSVMEHD